MDFRLLATHTAPALVITATGRQGRRPPLCLVVAGLRARRFRMYESALVSLA